MPRKRKRDTEPAAEQKAAAAAAEETREPVERGEIGEPWSTSVTTSSEIGEPELLPPPPPLPRATPTPPPLTSVLQVMVRFREGVTPERREAIHAASPGGQVQTIGGLDVDVVTVDSLGAMGAALAYYNAQDAEVEYAEADQPVQVALAPNDPYWAETWTNIPSPQKAQYGPRLINCKEAWDITLGTRNIAVAILDTGIDETHPELSSQIVATRNFSTATSAHDYYGHGTHVSGIVAAVVNNGAGIAGVAGRCALINAKCMNDSGGGSEAGVASAITWAADNGAAVISMSLQGFGNTATLQNAINYALARWVICVSIAGNTDVIPDGTISYPGGFQNVIMVASTDWNNQRSSFSVSSSKVWCAAPGSWIWSTWNTAVGSPFVKYAHDSGTSMAGPHVAGVVALMLSVNATMTLQQVLDAIAQTATDLGGAGRDNIFGYGLIHAQKCVQAALGASGTPSPSPTPTPSPTPANVQVTVEGSPQNARSENDLDVNPLNPLHLVGASKKFVNISTYNFVLGCHRSLDGGASWTESGTLALPSGTAILSDPCTAWDSTGHPYLVGLMADINLGIQGLCVHRSTDGGATWGTPTVIHSSGGDDKQDAVGDGSPASPYYGNVYVAWDDGANLRFARTNDQGASWRGTGAATAPGTLLSSSCQYSEMVVSPSGVLTIFYFTYETNQIMMRQSFDGGFSFAPAVLVASGINRLDPPSTQIVSGWRTFPGGNFRVVAMLTAAVTDAGHLMIAWPDGREGVGRTYHRRSTDGGATWLGSLSGSPLLSGAVASPAGTHDYMAVASGLPGGQLGVAFYEFGAFTVAGVTKYRNHVILVASADHGATWSRRVQVATTPWDPSIDAPLSHGDPNVTFIGDYFGMVAAGSNFVPAWTDTRTGIQEIWAARVPVT